MANLSNIIYLFATVSFLVLLQCWENKATLRKMEVIYKWDHIEFVYDDDEQKRDLEERGILIPGESAPFDVDSYRNRVFLSMPRVLPGSAVTLATMEHPFQLNNSRLIPYPNWRWHAANTGCDGLTSVFRIEADDCGRLWVIDSGVDLSLGDYRAICPPQLLVFNISTDELIVRHRFPTSACAKSLMSTIVTERMDNQCSDDVYAYIADARAYQVIVFHLRTQRSWTLSGDLFYPEVMARNFEVNNVRFSMMLGVMGLSLTTCINEQCDRYLLFHSVSGFFEGRVRTSLLRNESLFQNGAKAVQDTMQIVGYRPRQAIAQAISEEGVTFFGLVGDNTLNCWNYRKNYHRNNFHVVEHDTERISFVLGIKAKPDEEGKQSIGFISSNVQALFSGNYTRNSVYPVYVLYGLVEDIIKGTGCDIKDN